MTGAVDAPRSEASRVFATVVVDDETSGAEAGQVVGDLPPVPVRTAIGQLARCVGRSVRLLGRGQIRQPVDHVGEHLRFADGSHGRVYRETVANDAPTDLPVVLVVAFRLRGVRGWAHAAFRAESLLNTPLFVGFPGFVSKLWVAHDERGRYRGVYQWNSAARAHAYVRVLWWVLALVSHHPSIRYVVLPGVRRDELLANPAVLDRVPHGETGDWWRLVSVERSDGECGRHRHRGRWADRPGLGAARRRSRRPRPGSSRADACCSDPPER